jgi:hypothetical protein
MFGSSGKVVLGHRYEISKVNLLSKFIWRRILHASISRSLLRCVNCLSEVCHSRILLSGIQARLELDPRLKHSGVTPLG